ncbi:helix-turn-helix transcriptional regulator [Mycobacterium paraseoulense]|nr:LuxR family transcriptional regulator [Mycobacterium paraseoulense]MCV7398013.1 AAA family ATPase [Mycobacterium paraseoulense]BBZ70250.1 transcriptional regulator [Mycobacterium paraseoulense]
MLERFVSRQAEEQSLTEFLDSAPQQQRAIFITGDPGIGKTTLWLDAVSRASRRGFRVLTSRTAAAESVLAYTAMADLLSELDESIWADLPAPQREGLDAALLRRRDDAQNIDARAVAAAFLAVTDRLAARGPLLIAIDDLQWLDTSSANVVSFAARRLPAGAALLCTTRIEEAASRLQLPSPDAVRRLRLQPLTVGELRQVLLLHLGLSLSRPLLLRIHEIAGGNPFFALELAREISAHTRTSELSLPGSLDDLVRSRIGQLAPSAKDAMLAMASLPDPTVQLVAQALGATPDRVVELLAEAENRAVVAIDGNRLRFTHPVLAHGVYSGARPPVRRAMHRRLADLITEPELHARHLALSDPTGEQQTIAALDAAAEIARGRGAPAAAAELLELAIDLGANDPARRIRCATYYFDASDPTHARQILDNVVAELPAGPVRAEALHILGLVRLYDDSFLEAAELLEAGLVDSADDAELRVRILITLSFALLNAGRPGQAYERVQQAVVEAERLDIAPLLSPALGMRAMMDFMGGRGFDKPTLQRATNLEQRDPQVPLAFRPSVQLTLLRAWTGELEGAHQEMAAVSQSCITRGEEGELIFAAFHLALIDIWRGDLTNAAIIADETMELAAQLGGDFPLFIALTIRAAVAAYEGRVDDARRDLRDSIVAAQRCGSMRLAEWPATLRGFVEVSCGDYQAAVNALAPLLPLTQIFPEATEIISASFIPDAAEALIGLGRFDEAEPLVAALERNGTRLDRAWMLAVGARCRAMLLAGRGDLAAATATAERAMTEHERLPMAFERARTQLLLGQLQRRQRHRDAAAATLREALQTFEELGTTLWADRVRAELARGMSGRRRAEGLTPSEQRVADLAVSGMTNRDIAAALFISPKTVEVNLSRIYRKLGIRSRMELYRALESTNDPASPKE